MKEFITKRLGWRPALPDIRDYALPDIWIK